MHYLGQLPDLPLPHTGTRLRTRRKPQAQIVLCQGCCCGQTQRGLPAVPLEWLKPIWKTEKLNKIVQLTVSGCLGPCDLPNVCCIINENEQAWYGRLTTQEDYGVLLDWAKRCKEQNAIQPLPSELEHLRFQRWPSEQESGSFQFINQDPADIVLLTAADTEVLTWSEAVAYLPAHFPAVRALNLERLRDPRVFDAYLDDVLQECRVLVVRVLGGLGYWREPMEQIRLLAQAHDIRLICLPGDDQPDAQLMPYCTVPLNEADRVFRYCVAGGVVNANGMLRFLSDSYLGTQFGFDPPTGLPQCGIYHTGRSRISDELKVMSNESTAMADHSSLMADHSSLIRRPTAGVVFYRSHWVTGNLAPVDALIHALEERGLNVLAVFGPNLAAVLQSELLDTDLDVLITTTSFSLNAGDDAGLDSGGAVPGLSEAGYNGLDVPVLQAIFCSSSENVWAANIAGLTPRDIAMNVALPEFDGRIITTAVSFKNTLTHDSSLQTDIVRYQPRPDRIHHVADLARNWAALRRIRNSQKKVAILLANYPSKNARIGNAVGLDTPASLHGLLEALQKAGYDVGSYLPADGQALMENLIAASIQDPEFAGECAFRESAGWVAADQYAAWLDACPRPAHEGIENRWGRPEESPFFLADGSSLTTHHLPLTTHQSCGFPIPGLLFGNIFVGIQPARGYDQDPSAVYHSPDLPPPHYYLAFYRWLRDIFGAHAIIHLGKHGNLEWLPGKGSALSDSCYPEVILQDLPNIYPYIINNPGEGTQAKRRTAAVIVDHLIPPMTQAGTYGELRQLENLLDEYYTVQSLDPSKAPLILEQIGKLVHDSQIYRDFDLEQTPASPEWPEFFKRIDGYLCEIKEAQIRDGLHILGRLPEGDQLVDLLFSLVRVDNGSVPGLVKALATDLGLDYRALSQDLSAIPTESICNLKLAIGYLQCSEQSPPLRTCGDIVEALGQIARDLIRQCLRSESVEEVVKRVSENCKLQSANCQMQIERTLEFLRKRVMPKLGLCHQEIGHVLAALEGRFVPPGPSGAPTRGRADVLPTGRNFYSLDVRSIPTPTAWQVGWSAANALLERHRLRTGSYPESIALVVWGTSNMRTGGDDIAEVLALLGVRPCWDEENRRIIGIEPIELVELGRPRIDVTVRISGLFRDAFPNLIRLLNEAVALVASLQEPLDRNFVKAHIARDTALLSRGLRIEDRGLKIEDGGSKLQSRERERPEAMSPVSQSSILEPRTSISVEEAARLAGLRVFGSKPGAYGAGLLPVIDNRNWHSSEDLAEVYLAWSSFAYTGKEDEMHGDGREETEAFRLRLANTDVVLQNQDNREHDIFDSDDYFQFHGGLIAAVRAVAGQTPQAYLSDTSRTEDVRARTLHEEACRVFRSRVVNPRWLEGVMRHGYKGAVEMAATVDYLFGYDATAEVLEDWMYERLADAYLFDEKTQEFIRRHNPWAERAMIERLLEAAERGLWEHPDPETLQRLRDQHDANDLGLESPTVVQPGS
jgi:cobaltochelatase CobN